MPRRIANNCESREIAKVAIATKNSRCREESRFFCSVPPKAKTIIANPTRKKKWLMALLVKRGSGKLGVELLASGYACVWNARTNEPENPAWLHQA
jgi:hypothetical protein